MSNSFKKTKFRPVAPSPSEKEDKRFANKKFRKAVTQDIRNERPVLRHLRECSDVWMFDKDGKIYDPKLTKKDMRK